MAAGSLKSSRNTVFVSGVSAALASVGITSPVSLTVANNATSTVAYGTPYRGILTVDTAGDEFARFLVDTGGSVHILLDVATSTFGLFQAGAASGGTAGKLNVYFSTAGVLSFKNLTGADVTLRVAPGAATVGSYAGAASGIVLASGNTVEQEFGATRRQANLTTDLVTSGPAAALDYRCAVSIMDPRFGAKCDGTTNDTTAIQLAIDYVYGLGGGTVLFPEGRTTRANGLVLKQYVVLQGSSKIGQGGLNAGGAHLTQVSGGSGYLIDTPSSNIEGIAIRGLYIQGSYSGSGTSGGIRFQNVNWPEISGCTIRGFDGRGIDIQASDRPNIIGVLVNNCLMNRTRTAMDGAIYMASGVYDPILQNVEAGSSSASAAGSYAMSQAPETGTAQAGSSAGITLAPGANASNSYYDGAIIETTGGTGSGQFRYIAPGSYVGSTKVITGLSPAWFTTPVGASTTYRIHFPRCAAICLMCDNGQLSGVIAETSDIGLFVNGTKHKLSQVRAEITAGWGFVFGPSSSACHTGPGTVGYRNGLSADSVFTSFLNLGVSNIFDSPLSHTETADSNRPTHGFRDENYGDSNKVFWNNPLSFNHRTATATGSPSSLGGVFTFPQGVPKTLTANSTFPTIDGYSSWKEAYTVDTTVTGFGGGVNGQALDIVATSGKFIIQNNSSVKPIGGTHRLLVSRIYRFVNRNNIWYEIGGLDANSDTQTNLRLQSATINSGGKWAGMMCWDTTNLKPVWASAATAGGVWVDGAGTTVHTPV